jgi:hypothetical protein
MKGRCDNFQEEKRLPPQQQTSHHEDKTILPRRDKEDRLLDHVTALPLSVMLTGNLPP